MNCTNCGNILIRPPEHVLHDIDLCEKCHNILKIVCQYPEK